MPRRVILHAGFHKTGTTSVQEFLRANRPALKRQVAVRLKPQMRALLHAARAYSRDRNGINLDQAGTAFSNLLSDLPAMPRRTLILSAPDLCGALPGARSVPDYSAAPDLLYRFVTLIRPQLPQSEPILYLNTRATDDWLISAYWDHVRHGQMTADFPEFADRFAQADGLDDVARDIAARVPCITHRVGVEDCATHPFGPAAPLLDLCDLPDRVRVALTPMAQANRTPDIDVLLQLLAANRTAATEQARRAAKQAVLAKAGL